MRTLRLAALMLLVVACAPAPRRPAAADSPAAGAWQGSLTFRGASLPLRLRFTPGGDTLAGTLSSADLLLLEQPLDSVTVQGRRVRFLSHDAPPLRFDGVVRGDSLLATATLPAVPGIVEAGAAGVAARLAMRRDRSRDPAAPIRKEVRFASGGVSLAGTLYTPATAATRSPALVLLQGSSSNLRREYRFYADAFARAGFVVLTFDKRGNGESTGDYGAATYETLADDGAAAVRYLAARPEADARRTGLWGLSQGAFLAPFVAARAPVAFIVAVSAPGMTIGESAAYQDSVRLAQGGFGAPEIRQAMALDAQLVRWLHDGPQAGRDSAALAAGLARVQSQPWRRASSLPTLLPDPRPLAGWYWRGRTLDPLPAWRAVHVPVLAIFGADDELVPGPRSAAAIANALRVSGDRDVTVRVFPAANHVIRTLPLRAGMAWDWPRAAAGYRELTLAWLRAHAQAAIR